MSEKEITEVLERLRQRLPEKPDWIAIVSVDGLYLAGTSVIDNLDTKNFVAAYTVGLEANVSRLTSFSQVGDFAFNISAGERGFLLVFLLEPDKYLMTMKFSNKTSFYALSVLDKALPNALKDLQITLRENPL